MTICTVQVFERQSYNRSIYHVPPVRLFQHSIQFPYFMFAALFLHFFYIVSSTMVLLLIVCHHLASTFSIPFSGMITRPPTFVAIWCLKGRRGWGCGWWLSNGFLDQCPQLVMANKILYSPATILVAPVLLTQMFWVFS